MIERAGMPTASAEDYLKQILLGEEASPEGRVATGALAQALGVTPGSVTARMKSLAEAGWIEYEAYAGARLTEEGRRVAVEMVRRHRLLERFLVEVLGLDWTEVHEEAERLEHAVSDRLIAKIDAMLGYPRIDPHGDPIPSASGEFEVPPTTSLVEAPLGVSLKLVRTVLQDSPFLRWLDQVGLVLGSSLVLEARDPLAGTCLLRLSSGKTQVLSDRVAGVLWVTVADETREPSG